MGFVESALFGSAADPFGEPKTVSAASAHPASASKSTPARGAVDSSPRTAAPLSPPTVGGELAKAQEALEMALGLFQVAGRLRSNAARCPELAPHLHVAARRASRDAGAWALVARARAFSAQVLAERGGVA